MRFIFSLLNNMPLDNGLLFFDYKRVKASHLFLGGLELGPLLTKCDLNPSISFAGWTASAFRCSVQAVL